VKVAVGNVVTAYVGSLYEVNPSSGVTATYYYAGSTRIAPRTAAGLTYLTGDHLGSASLATNAAGSKVADQRYLPYGATRVVTGTMPTDYQFTSQRLDSGTGLYYYGARYYDAALGRFVSADSIVPSAGKPQALNRYSYALNNPARYRDPTGHWFETAWDLLNIGWDFYEAQQDPSFLNVGALLVDVGAAMLPVVPGGAGLLLRGGKTAKVAAEAASHADDAETALRMAGHLGDAAHAALSAELALNSARRLAEVGLESKEAGGLVADLARLSTHSGSAEKGVTVLGHSPYYIAAAKKMEATHLEMTGDAWNTLSDGQRWAVNQRFLDDAMARGDKFFTATDVWHPGFFQRELDYLAEKGYTRVGDYFVKAE
jgi:RHS repeat-associated protein